MTNTKRKTNWRGAHAAAASATDEAACDTLLVADVSQRLRLGINQTYRALERGEIPGRRIGRRWIVPRIAFEQWLAGAGSSAAA